MISRVLRLGFGGALVALHVLFSATSEGTPPKFLSPGDPLAKDLPVAPNGIAGIVTTDVGQRLPSVTVSLGLAGTPTGIAVTDSEGRFAFANVPPRSSLYIVEVRWGEELVYRQPLFIERTGRTVSIEIPTKKPSGPSAGAIVTKPVSPTLSRLGVDLLEPPAGLQAKLEAAVLDYHAWLVRIGYDPDRAKGRVNLVVSENRNVGYFDRVTIVAGSNVAHDVQIPYTYYVLEQSNPPAFAELWVSPFNHADGFMRGLPWYFASSHRNEALRDIDKSTVWVRGDRKFHTLPDALPAIWGGAFWDLRKILGRDKTDRLLFSAWKAMPAPRSAAHLPNFFVNPILDASKAVGQESDVPLIREVFARRGLNY